MDLYIKIQEYTEKISKNSFYTDINVHISDPNNNNNIDNAGNSMKFSSVNLSQIFYRATMSKNDEVDEDELLQGIYIYIYRYFIVLMNSNVNIY